MKCWISNSFHRESQFRLPRPPYARSSSSISDPLKCICSGKTGLAQSQVGRSLGTPRCIPPSFPPGVLQSQISAPFPGSPLVDVILLWGLRILCNLPRLSVREFLTYSSSCLPSPTLSPSSLDLLSAAFLTSVTPLQPIFHLPYKKDVTFIWHYKVYEVLYL